MILAPQTLLPISFLLILKILLVCPVKWTEIVPNHHGAAQEKNACQDLHVFKVQNLLMTFVIMASSACLDAARTTSAMNLCIVLNNAHSIQIVRPTAALLAIVVQKMCVKGEKHKEIIVNKTKSAKVVYVHK